jgi:hypothetical protein
MMETVAKAIFVTNTFANAHPNEHVALWEQFEKEVPINERSGAYGVDNMAYIRWLRQQNNPIVNQFLKDNIIQKSF